MKSNKESVLMNQQDGAAEACYARNPEVGKSKLPPAKKIFMCKKSRLFSLGFFLYRTLNHRNLKN